jgi:GNAT superfamily N-acetyltransferase
VTVASDTIRPMTAADTAPAADLLRRGDFGDRSEFFEWAVTRPTIGLFVAERDGAIVGTGVGSAHGPVGWVGVIFVASGARGAGLGRRITRTVIERLEEAGCRSQALIASPMGRPIYEREGFRVIERQIRFTIDGLSAADDPGDPRVRAFASADAEAVLTLDRAVTGEDRSTVIRELVTLASTIVAIGPDGEVRGYLARAPWRGGAVIAPSVSSSGAATRRGPAARPVPGCCPATRSDGSGFGQRAGWKSSAASGCSAASRSTGSRTRYGASSTERSASRAQARLVPADSLVRALRRPDDLPERRDEAELRCPLDDGAIEAKDVRGLGLDRLDAIADEQRRDDLRPALVDQELDVVHGDPDAEHPFDVLGQPLGEALLRVVHRYLGAISSAIQASRSRSANWPFST